MISTKRKIKIVYIIGRLVVGGAERQIVETAARLNKDCFVPKLYCLSEGGPLESFVRQHDIDAEIFDSTQYNSSNIFSFLLIRIRKFLALYRYLKREQPDIVHCYMYAPSIYGGIVSKLTGVPLLITSRRCLGLFKDRKPHFQFLENVVNRFTDRVLVNSSALEQDVLQREKIDPQKLRIVHNGVDIHRYAPTNTDKKLQAHILLKKRAWGIPEQAPVVGVLATLFPYKGHQDFIRAVSVVHRTYPDVRFICVGGDRGIKMQLEQLGHDLGLGEHLIFPGECQDAAEVLPMFDIQVSSSHEEGFSNAILEGMALGKPIAATSVGGTPDAVLHNVTGLLVPPKSPEALAQAIMLLIRNPDFASTLGKNGRQRVEECFSMEHMINELENTYCALYES